MQHTTQPKKAKNGKAQRASAVQRASQPGHTSDTARKMPAYTAAARRPVQTKVAVGPAGDSFEQEADSVAQRVRSGGNVAPDSLSSISGQKPQKTEKKKPVQKADEKKPETGPAAKQVQKSDAKNAPGTGAQQEDAQAATEAAKDTATAQDQAALDEAAEQAIRMKGPGRPLTPATKQTLSERMGGVDLDHVRIHEGPDAHEACRALHARAFTHGSDIWLAAGETDTNIDLMAHEVTHVIQQSSHIHRAVVQRKGKKGGSGSSGGKDNDESAVDAGNSTVTIEKLKLPKFKVDGRKETPKPYAATPLTVKKRPATKQKDNWVAAAEGNVRTGVKEKFDTAAKKAPGGAAPDVLFFTTSKSKLPKRPEPKKNAPKGKDKNAYPVIFGTQDEVVVEATVPYWDKEGKEHNYDIDHVREMQLGGDDAPPNYELLDWEANRSAGRSIRDEILRAFNEAVAPKGKLDPAFKSAPNMDNLIAKGWTIQIEKVVSGLAVAGEPDTYWSLKNIQDGDHLKRLRALSEEEIEDSGLRGTDAEMVVYSSSGGGKPRFIPWAKGDTGKKTITIDNFYPGFQLQELTYKPTAAVGESCGRLQGKLSVNGKIFTKTDVPADKKLKVDFGWDLKKPRGVDQGGYIDDTKILPTLLANLSKVAGMSPIIFEQARLDDDKGLIAVGQIMPTVPVIKDIGIELVLEGESVRVRKLFSAGDFSFPGPIKATGGSLEIFADLDAGLGVSGKLYYAIEKVGTGHIGATAKTGKSVAEAGFAVEGEFVFDPKLVENAKVSAWYRKEGNGEYDFGVAGTIHIKEGKIKAVKSADIELTYANSKFAATGSAQLTIPGIQQVNLGVMYDEKEGLAITGTLTLAETKFIQSGSGTVTVNKKEGDEYRVSASGTAVPKIPGISAAVAFTVNDDLFTVEGSAGYEKGMLKGSILIGATNRPVGDDGKPADGPPKKDVTIYGGGLVTLKLSPWLQASAGIKLLPNGEIEVVGKIGLPAAVNLLDEKKWEKNLFKINLDIPILGISAAGQNVGIFATIGGGLDLDAGIGPAQIKDLGLEITYNPAREEETHIVGTAKLHIPAHAGLRLFVRGGLGVGIPVVDARAGLEVGARLGLEGALDAGVQVDWTPTKGLVIDAKAGIFVEPKMKFDLKAFVEVELDLWVKTVTLYEDSWDLASFEWGSGLRFGVELPIHYEEGKPFNVSLDDLKFTIPDISPMDVLSGVVKQIID